MFEALILSISKAEASGDLRPHPPLHLSTGTQVERLSLVVAISGVHHIGRIKISLC